MGRKTKYNFDELLPNVGDKVYASAEEYKIPNVRVHLSLWAKKHDRKYVTHFRKESNSLEIERIF